MSDQERGKSEDPEVIVEYVPRSRGRRFYHYGARTRPVSPLGFVLLAAAGAVVLCLVLTVGFIMLGIALGAGLLLLLRRRLVRK